MDTEYFIELAIEKHNNKYNALDPDCDAIIINIMASQSRSSA